MSSLWASLIVGVLCLLICKGDAHFRKIPSETYQEPQGMSLELPCVTDQTDVICTWLRNGNVIPSRGRFKYNLQSAHGDCSINIHNITYPEDNVVWECQIPTIQDAPTRWPRASITVLVKPEQPKLTIDTFASKPTVIADRLTNVYCESSGGNPFARFEWLLNGVNITSNSTILPTGSDSVVKSRLSRVFTQKDHRQTLKCVTIHPLATQIISKDLDIHYKPIVTVSQKVFTVNEGADLEVNCTVEANPPTHVLWKPITDKDIRDSYVIRDGKLMINSIRHNLDGIEFQCSAINQIGSSKPESVQLNVHYNPVLLEFFPANQNQRVNIGSDLTLGCRFNANPKPEIRWFFVDSFNHKNQVLNSDDGDLVLRNISYLQEGDYFCEGVNFNSSTNLENVVRNRPFSVKATGRPQFLSDNVVISAYNGINSRLENVFCSDPAPKRVYWRVGEEQYDVDLGSKRLKEEENEIRISTFRLIPIHPSESSPKCFTTVLSVLNTNEQDQRDYKVTVENSMGSATSIVTLEIQLPYSAALLISVGVLVLLGIVVFTTFALLFMRRRDALTEDDHSSPEKLEKGEKIALEMNN